MLRLQVVQRGWGPRFRRRPGERLPMLIDNRSFLASGPAAIRQSRRKIRTAGSCAQVGLNLMLSVRAPGRGMKLFFASVMLGGILLTGSAFLAGGAGLSRSSRDDHTQSASPTAKIVIEYPLEGSVFPPEITPPTFLWRDDSKTAKRWVVEVSFADHSDGIRVEAPGEHMQKGAIDPLTVSEDAPPTIT